MIDDHPMKNGGVKAVLPVCKPACLHARTCACSSDGPSASRTRMQSRAHLASTHQLASCAQPDNTQCTLMNTYKIAHMGVLSQHHPSMQCYLLTNPTDHRPRYQPTTAGFGLRGPDRRAVGYSKRGSLLAAAAVRGRLSRASRVNIAEHPLPPAVRARVRWGQFTSRAVRAGPPARQRRAWRRAPCAAGSPVHGPGGEARRCRPVEGEEGEAQ